MGEAGAVQGNLFGELRPDAGRVEAFANVRGRMVPGPVFGRGQQVQADPFADASIPIDLSCFETRARATDAGPWRALLP